MSQPEDATLWQLRVGLWGTEAEAADLQQKVMHTLCPDPDHEGSCPIPWQIWLDKLGEFGDDYSALEEQVRIESSPPEAT